MQMGGISLSGQAWTEFSLLATAAKWPQSTVEWVQPCFESEGDQIWWSIDKRKMFTSQKVSKIFQHQTFVEDNSRLLLLLHMVNIMM